MFSFGFFVFRTIFFASTASGLTPGSGPQIIHRLYCHISVVSFYIFYPQNTSHHPTHTITNPVHNLSCHCSVCLCLACIPPCSVLGGVR
uniref:Putative secreted protein n=1 Tax=Anopheles marajoara TaxID=58244 RepID=A0A2M4CA05_9DIPT